MKKKPYYSFLHKYQEGKTEDTFYEPVNYTWVNNIEQNWEVILKEVTQYLNKDTGVLKPFYSEQMVSAPNKWKSFNFSFWGIQISNEACDACPKTIKLLKRIPHIVAASVSVLEPHAEIKTHRGDTDAIYRCHLGLDIPDGLPNCGFQVGNVVKAWKNGKILMFNDAANHRAWNNTGEKRIIMIIDVIKPEFENQKRIICAKVFGSIIFQTFNAKFPIFKKKTGWLVRFIYWINSMFILICFIIIKRRSSWLS
jgi:aspartyl/asparaginyl beta-hydroxylase (cupin superfamily)